jgi:uncharacterized protein
MRAVVDTNVLLSGLLWRGTPHDLIERARTGALTLLTSPALLDELADVINRVKFRMILERANVNPKRLLAEVRDLAEVVDPPPLASPVSRDPDDDAVLALALAAQADFIVSGDDDLLALCTFANIRIVSPAEALTFLSG